MSRSRSLVGWVAVLSGALFVAPVTGCDKKKDGESSDKSEKATKDDDSSDKKKKKSKDGDEKYATGELFKHVPKACKYVRVYVNIGLFLKNEAVEKSAESLEEKISTSMKKKDGKAVGKVLKSLKKSGIDPARDVKELVVCGNDDKDDMVFALGGNFAGKDPIGAIAKAAEDSGEKDLEKKESDGVEYVKDGKAFVGAVSPNVLVVTRSKASFADLKDTSGSATDWDVDKGRIVAFKVNDKKKGKFTGTISENGEDLDFKLIADFAGDLGEKIEDDPAKFKKGFDMQKETLEKKLSKGPFKKIADDIGSAKVKVDGTKVTVTCTVPASDLGDALKKVADMDEDQIDTAVDL